MLCGVFFSITQHGFGVRLGKNRLHGQWCVGVFWPFVVYLLFKHGHTMAKNLNFGFFPLGILLCAPHCEISKTI